jgi:hypothetical protein
MDEGLSSQIGAFQGYIAGIAPHREDCALVGAVQTSSQGEYKRS